MNQPGTNTGHGHVWARPDGVRMRCGGPAICSECARDAAELQITPLADRDDYIEKAQRRLIEADKIMRGAASDDVLAPAEEAQIQATIAVGYILLKISDQLDAARGPKPGSWAGR